MSTDFPECIEQGCQHPVCTDSKYWCARHENERRERITRQLGNGAPMNQNNKRTCPLGHKATILRDAFNPYLSWCPVCGAVAIADAAFVLPMMAEDEQDTRAEAARSVMGS